MINYVNTSGIQNINGVKTFTSLPECSNGSPTLDNQLVNKFYVDRLPIHITVSGIISNLSRYQLQSDMVNYLTVSSSIYTYQPKSDMINYVNTSGNQNINGLKTFYGDIFVQNINVNSAVNILNSGNLFIMSMNGTAMIFDPTYNSSLIQFVATDISGRKKACLEMNTANTIIGNKLQVHIGAMFNNGAVLI